MGHELAVEVVEAPAGSGFVAGEICAVNPYLSCGHCVACRADKPNCCVNISVLGVHQDGGMAEMLALPAANLVRAEGLTADQCASVEFLAIGAHAVRRGAVRRATKRWWSARGRSASASRSSPACRAPPSRCTTARSFGQSCGVSDRRRGSRSVRRPEPGGARITNGDGFDVVFDATGNGRSMEAGFDFVAHGGRYVLSASSAT